MANIGTVTTNANPFIWPSTTLLVRKPSTIYDEGTAGYLFCLVKSSTADVFELRRSVDNGANWTVFSTVTRANVAEMGPIHIDPWNWGFWVYRTNESSQDRIYCRIFSSFTGEWGPECLLAAPSNGGVAGAIYNGLDIKTVSYSGPHTIAVAVGTSSGGFLGLSMFTANALVGVSPGPVPQPSLMMGTIMWIDPTDSDTGTVTPSMDIEHNGDGYTGGALNLWVCFGRQKLNMVKLAFVGNGWSGPTSFVQVASGFTAQNSMTGRWDGSRYIMAAPGASPNTDKVILYERNQANTVTIARQSQTHPTGAVRTCTLAYDATNNNVRVYAVGTSTAVLYYCDYIRATDTWSSWTIAVATAILGSGVDNYGVKRSTYDNSRYDLYTAHATPSPNTLVHTQQSLSYPPGVPTWVTANAQGRDVAITLPLDWNFSDPDPSDAQTAYAVSRQIGAGALAYWRASDSTWQAAEVKNVSGTTILTLAASWGAGSDATHTYRVKVWDGADVASLYSTGLAVIPSVKVNPTITSPTAAQVLTGDTVLATWTVSEQTAYKIRLVTGGVTVYDSGFVSSSTPSGTPAYSLQNNTSYSLFLITKNLEGLSSDEIQRDFSVLFIEPATPTTTAVPMPSLGVMRVTITNPTPVGTQPALTSQELWRRPVASPFLAEFDFETDLSGWVASAGGAGVATITRDNTFAHKGSWSMKVVPAGGGPNAYGETTATYPAAQNQAWEAAAWIYTVTANKPATVWMHWFTAGSVYIISSLTQRAAVAGAWLYVSVIATPPPTATKFVIAAGVSNNPGVGDISYVDEVWGRLADASAGVRIAYGILSGGTVDDWRAVSGVSYEYRAAARGANNTTTPGAWRQ